MPMGMHDHVDSLRRELQLNVDQFEKVGCERILFVFGLCSNSILGLTSRSAELVFPRAHDCVTLFLGSKERYASIHSQEPGTYWYTPGWIRGKRVPGPHHFEAKYQEYLEKFDEEDADYLIEMERDKFRHYQTLAYTDLGDGPTRESREEARVAAKFLGLQFREYEGDEGLLRRLLTGPWDPQEFLVVPPGQTATHSADAAILRCTSCNACSSTPPKE